MVEAIAEPRNNANHTSTRRVMNLAFLRVCMGGNYVTDHHGHAYKDHRLVARRSTNRPLFAQNISKVSSKYCGQCVSFFHDHACMIYFEFVILALRLEPVSLLTGFSNQRVNGFLNAFRNLRTHLRTVVTG